MPQSIKMSSSWLSWLRCPSQVCSAVSHAPLLRPHRRPTTHTPRFAGGVVIKYGSLLLDAPFQPDPSLALGIVFGVPALFASWMQSRSR